MMVTAVLTDAFREGGVGIGIKYRIDGKLFNLSRFPANTKDKYHTIRNLLFAHGGSEVHLQDV